MRIRRVTYDLGNVIERQEYLDGRYGAPGEKRAKKKKATPEEVEQVNQWTRERKARHRLRMYFKVNDYFFTLTYPKEERPSDMKQAKQDFKEFYLFCKKEYKKRGQELRWIRNIECTPSGNWHIHVVLNRIPDTDLIIAAAWKHGKVRNKQLLMRKASSGSWRNMLPKTRKPKKNMWMRAYWIMRLQKPIFLRLETCRFQNPKQRFYTGGRKNRNHQRDIT